MEPAVEGEGRNRNGFRHVAREGGRVVHFYFVGGECSQMSVYPPVGVAFSTVEVHRQHDPHGVLFCWQQCRSVRVEAEGEGAHVVRGACEAQILSCIQMEKTLLFLALISSLLKTFSKLISN